MTAIVIIIAKVTINSNKRKSKGFTRAMCFCYFQHIDGLVPVQSFTPVLVSRNDAASGSLPATMGLATTLTHSAIESVPPPVASQVSADSRYAEFANVSPEKL